MRHNTLLGNVTLFVVIFLLVSCDSKSNKVDKMQRKIDSLEESSNKATEKLKYIKEKNPNILISIAYDGENSIKLFEPFGLNIKLHHIRPTNEDIYLCVPAAYTTIENQVDGIFIEDGVKIKDTMNPNLTGFCVISSDSIEIRPIDDLNVKLIDKIALLENSAFQQTLLVMQKEIVPCKLFGDGVNVRRALIQFDNFSCIGESEKPLKINDFQKLLTKIGAINALNLDMGTWSEGWYRNQYCKIIKIGENMINTNKQSNWIVFTKR